MHVQMVVYQALFSPPTHKSLGMRLVDRFRLRIVHNSPGFVDSLCNVYVTYSGWFNVCLVDNAVQQMNGLSSIPSQVQMRCLSQTLK